jgi:hypothetical protein
MRPRVLIGTATIVIGWLAACSKPAPETGKSGRDLSLPTPAASEAPLVSTLEAGQTATRVPLLQPSHRASPPASMEHQMAEVPARIKTPDVTVPQVAPALSSTGLSLASAPEHLPMDIEAEWQRNAKGQDEGAYPLPTPGPSHHFSGIILRGGPGAIDDKCDLRPRGGRGGTAVNRSAPSFGQGIR